MVLALVGASIAGAQNTKIQSFNKAKKHLASVYAGYETTFYCGCKYSKKQVDYKGCAYVPTHPKNQRANRIEWEHVVPAHHFGQSFPEWRNGHPACKSKGKQFKGRNCARKVAVKFRYMESDMYNLVPAIGEVNNFRGNLHVGLVPKSKLLGGCATKMDDKFVEPRDEVKGFVARVYKYMESAYPGHGIVSSKNQRLYDEWDAMYPATSWELERAKRIAKVQGNENPFVSKTVGVSPKQKAKAKA